MMEESDKENCCLVIPKFIFFYRNVIIQIIWPIISLCVFFLGTEKKIRCLYISVIMFGYWVTMCIPHYVTALLPAIMMPLLAVEPITDVCKEYLHETNMLFCAGTVLSITLKHSGLPKRMALRFMLSSGCTVRKLNFTCTLLTAVLSMWYFNHTVINMMGPTILTLLTEMEQKGIGAVFKPKSEEAAVKPEVPTNITKAFFISCAFATLIGGIGTLMGNANNLNYKGLYHITYPAGNRLAFLEFMYLNAAPMVIILLLMWLSIQFLLMGLFRNNADSLEVQKYNEKQNEIKEIVSKQLKDLGPLSGHEISVLIVLLLCTIFWMTTYPGTKSGWKYFFPQKFQKQDHFDITQTAHPILAVIVISAIPTVCVCKKACSLKITDRPNKNSPSLMPWEVFQTQMPWGVLLHIGAGFSLANSIEKSGLSEYLISKLSLFSVMNIYILLASLVFSTLVTIILAELIPPEVVCNVALMIVMQWSGAMKLHPIVLTYPVTICSMWNFCSNRGSSTNKLMVEYAKLSNSDLLKYGIFTKIVSWLVSIIVLPLLIPYVYEVDQFPDWALPQSNITLQNVININ